MIITVSCPALTQGRERGYTKVTYVQKCMQWRKWRNWRKIASCWRFELDAKSGPLEAGDFGKNGENGEKSPASGDLTWMPKVAPWRLAIFEDEYELYFIPRIVRLDS